jgi:hypothetical protein
MLGVAVLMEAGRMALAGRFREGQCLGLRSNESLSRGSALGGRVHALPYLLTQFAGFLAGLCEGYIGKRPQAEIAPLIADDRTEYPRARAGRSNL